jgi:asparagine synthase (glutamine-hydrolysing)
MGGFVLLHTTPGEDRSGMLAAAAETFGRDPRAVRGDNYLLALLPKRQASEPTIEQFPNGDFVAACGTLIYDDKIGKDAAIAFYRDHGRAPAPRSRALGHYAVILRKAGKTEIVPDSFGGFHIFCDRAGRVASSSFLAVAATLEQMTVGAQSACEYVFDGVVSGNATLFDEVVLPPVNGTLALRADRIEVVPHQPYVPMVASHEPPAAMAARSMALLDRYFSAVAKNFGDRVTCALSGGYDSRLILAMLRRHGVRPRVYVYGPRGDKDVEMAQTIARGEGFALEVVDKDKHRDVPPEEFAAVAHANFVAGDGYSWGGIFDNGAELDQRASRVSGNAIVLNGGGGEIFRNFFYLPDRSYSRREILWTFYSQFDPATCTAGFDEDAYYGRLEDKLALLIGDERDPLPRPLVEWLYHNFRCRAWDGKANSINTTYGYVALPFLERPVTEHASVIPIAWKNHGAYEAELIRRADPKLACYPSIYGHDFGGSPPLSRRLVDYTTYLRPPWLRRFSYRVKHRARRSGEWPEYLRKAYRDAALPGGVQVMNALFQLDRVADPAQLARILSLEYLIRQFGGRVRLDLAAFSTAGPMRCAA